MGFAAALGRLMGAQACEDAGDDGAAISHLVSPDAAITPGVVQYEALRSHLLLARLLIKTAQPQAALGVLGGSNPDVAPAAPMPLAQLRREAAPTSAEAETPPPGHTVSHHTSQHNQG